MIFGLILSQPHLGISDRSLFEDEIRMGVLPLITAHIMMGGQADITEKMCIYSRASRMAILLATYKLTSITPAHPWCPWHIFIVLVAILTTQIFFKSLKGEGWNMRGSKHVTSKIGVNIYSSAY